jgi:hypothetical protein
MVNSRRHSRQGDLMLVRIDNWPIKRPNIIAVTVRPLKDEGEWLEYWQQTLAERIRQDVFLHDTDYVIKTSVLPIFGGRQILPDAQNMIITIELINPVGNRTPSYYSTLAVGIA